MDDLPQFEAIENAQDLADAQAALVDGGEPILWEELKARLDAVHGIG